VLRCLRGDRHPFALVGSWAGGGAIVGSEPVALSGPGDDPFALLDRRPVVEGTGAQAVGGGWVGYLGFGLGARLEVLPPPPPRPVPLPPFSWAFYDHLLRLDAGGRWWFEALWSPGSAQRLETRLERLRSRPVEPAAPAAYRCGPFSSRPDGAAHAEAVRWCRRWIAAGDLYQANLCLRLEANFEGSALELFADAAARLEPARAAYLEGPWGAVASLSPELFLSRRGDAVRSLPIKGTSPRSPDPVVAERQRRALERSGKDAAENVMIVDLMRNDLGRVCAYGTVHVPALARAEPHPGLWHLVSEVRGTLRPGVGDGRLVGAAFPPGSVTGAPKIKALEVISTLESTGREIYTGAIGFASPLAGLELNVAIRTFEIAGDRVWLGAGGGVVADSDPEGEVAESLTKAAPLLAAVGAKGPPTGGNRLGRGGSSAAPSALPPPLRLPRPDPARGVFTTLLAVDGRPVELEAHLSRLASSAAGLGLAVAADARDSVLAACPAEGLAAVRVAIEETALRLDTAPVTAERVLPETGLTVAPVRLPGGLGAHKWVDRRLLETATAAAGAEPLLLDLDGEVLETARGSIWIVEGDTLLTPPADGRILPGVTRALIFELAPAAGLRARAARLSLSRLTAADEVLVTSAVRGVQGLTASSGLGARERGPVAAALAEAVRGRWRLPQRPPTR
jgi:para-aminobenzoate synthetase/4-amino-4-deoxychorismate lyase